MTSRRSAYQAIHGVLLLDKPLGFSSNKALQKIRHLFCAKKAGHTGSLDPLATGLLPICFGDGTKFSEYLLNSTKSYQVTAQLGIKTTTGDREGDILSQVPSSIDQETLAEALNAFKGEILQVPPMYSALKHHGQPLYKLARAGKEVHREPRKITIHACQQLDFSYEVQQFKLHVTCSKGTYLRSLVEDIGEKLGVGAHVINLRRTQVGDFSLEQSHKMDDLVALEGSQKLGQRLLPVDICVAALPSLHLDADQSLRLGNGQKIEISMLDNSGEQRIYGPSDHFIGIGVLSDTGILRAKRLIAN